MKKQKFLFCLFSIFLVAIILCMPAFAKETQGSNINDIKLYVGGMPFGARISSKGLTVVKFSETQGEMASSAYLAGIRQGDIITKINGININTIEDFVGLINKSGGKELKITVERNNREMLFNVVPKYSTDDGKYKTGIWVKDSTSGIGTVTYINPKKLQALQFYLKFYYILFFCRYKKRRHSSAGNIILIPCSIISIGSVVRPAAAR